MRLIGSDQAYHSTLSLWLLPTGSDSKASHHERSIRQRCETDLLEILATPILVH